MLTVVLTTDGTATSDFVSFVAPKIKLSSASKTESASGVTVSANFQALLNDVVSGEDTTTLSIQDSEA
jgi:hypothetical protein